MLYRENRIDTPISSFPSKELLEYFSHYTLTLIWVSYVCFSTEFYSDVFSWVSGLLPEHREAL